MTDSIVKSLRRMGIDWAADEIERLRAECKAKDTLIAEQNKLAKERQEWALHTNEMIRSLRAELDALKKQEPVATLHDDGHFTFKTGKESHESRYAGWRMDVFAAPQPAIPNGWVISPVVRTAPGRIYLVIGEECPDDANFNDLDLCGGVTWCADKIDHNSIGYVRADLASQPATPDDWIATHLKTGNEYRVIGEAINATNAQDGQTMVIYERAGVKYVREAGEFMEKFSAAQKPGDVK